MSSNLSEVSLSVKNYRDASQSKCPLCLVFEDTLHSRFESMSTPYCVEKIQRTFKLKNSLGGNARFIWGPTGMLLAVPLVAYFKAPGCSVQETVANLVRFVSASKILAFEHFWTTLCINCVSGICWERVAVLLQSAEQRRRETVGNKIK
jgi:hypothetical protein